MNENREVINYNQNRFGFYSNPAFYSTYFGVLVWGKGDIPNEKEDFEVEFKHLGRNSKEIMIHYLDMDEVEVVSETPLALKSIDGQPLEGIVLFKRKDPDKYKMSVEELRQAGISV